MASGELIASFDSGEMVRQARILAQSTAELIQAIKGEAETQSDSELQVSYLIFTEFLAHFEVFSPILMLFQRELVLFVVSKSNLLMCMLFLQYQLGNFFDVPSFFEE